ncbi:hypothetical protein PC118_g5993 [Phytophthora cactorum]|uniref:Uncharacterized protein n=1 Tax=Phytophthora cactorum TaxID=29920 RepID=A0A8T1G6F0_9STRA|nr:hypothetical protein PC118_g5993 [Phytophthora cactorum]
MVGTRGSAPPGEAASGQDTKNFKLVWAAFKAAGWTSKPSPHGIGTLWNCVAREQTVERLHGGQAALAAAGNGAATTAVSSRSASVQAFKNTSPSKPSTRKTKASSRKLKSPVSELKSKKLKIKPMTHVQYMSKLHMQLITLTANEIR